MTTKNTDCLIIFTRNPELGKGKRRLAATVGDQAALEIYKFLLAHTRKITKDLQATKKVWYSEEVQKNDDWDNRLYHKYAQEGEDLGVRMKIAFLDAFKTHEHVIIIGSDMHDMNTADLENAFKKLLTHDAVIGPAEDGGYYLLGFNKKLVSGIFENKEWGTATVLEKTLENLKDHNYALLEERNDVDYYDDIKNIPAFQPFFKTPLMLSKKQLDQSIEYLKAQGFEAPEVGIILGTGLGQLVDSIENQKVAHYNQIPSFPLATVEFHSGKLIYGDLGGKKVVVMQGRFHLYEGYDFIDITYPVRVMHGLGIKNLLVSNAAGAVNLDMKKGDLMLIEDHINLQGGSPLAFKGVSAFGERFTDMSAPYDKGMNEKLKVLAANHGIALKEGVYASVVGPQLETRSEYRMLKILGADAVGMSTVPEIIVANHLNLPVSAISVLTDECDPDNLEPVNINEIIAIAEKAEPKMVTLFKGLIQLL